VRAKRHGEPLLDLRPPLLLPLWRIGGIDLQQLQQLGVELGLDRADRESAPSAVS
jgi:hypothetical protein